jgi:hypothetical protein
VTTDHAGCLVATRLAAPCVVVTDTAERVESASRSGSAWLALMIAA